MSRRQPRQQYALQRERLPGLLDAIKNARARVEARTKEAGQELQSLIEEQGEDPNQRAADGETPLMAAGFTGSDDMAYTLLRYGADPGVLSANGSSALSAAVFGNNPAIVRRLLCHGGPGVKQAALQHGLEQLLQTAQTGLEMDRVSTYCGAGGGCSSNDHMLHLRLTSCNHHVAEDLKAWFAKHAASAAATPVQLDSGGAGSSSTGSCSSGSSGGGARGGNRSTGSCGSSSGSGGGAGGSTSSSGGGVQSVEQSQLHFAEALNRPLLAESTCRLLNDQLVNLVVNGDVATLSQALRDGADPNATDDRLNNLLMIAATFSNVEAAHLLLDTRRCDVGRVNSSGWNALHCAAREGHVYMIKLLLDAGLDVNSRTFYDDTPLLAAVSRGHLDAVKALIAAGADLWVQNISGATALGHATDCGFCNIIAAILDAPAGLDVNTSDVSSGCTALIVATQSVHPAAIKLLLSRGADPNKPDVSGFTALYWAMRSKEPEAQLVIEALKRAGGRGAPPEGVLLKVLADEKRNMDFKAISRGVMSALIPDSKRQECLAKLEEAELEVKGRARSGRGRSSGVAAARAAAGARGSPAAVGASSQPERSREEADRIAAQLLAEEEGERAKAQAAQAKKGKRERQKAQARAVEATVADEEAAATERERRQHQQEGLDAGDSSSNGAAAAVPAADAGVGAAVAVPGTRQPLSCAPIADAAVQQLAGLSMGSAPAPAAPLLQLAVSSNQHLQPAAPTAQQRQPRSTQGTSTTAAYEDDERLCVVCIEGQRCMVLVPCGHLVMCQECCAAVEAASNECPMCRAAIDVAVALNL